MSTTNSWDESKPGKFLSDAPTGEADTVSRNPSEPAAQSEPTILLVKKHPLAIRWFHWVNFPVLFIMIWSGMLILWANDAYPTEQFRVRVPNRVSLYRWGIAPVYGDKEGLQLPSLLVKKSGIKLVSGGGRDDNFPVPAEQRYDINTGFRLSDGMAWHFTFAWLFTLNGVAYALFLLFSGEWKHLIPHRESLVEAFKVALHDVGLWKQPPPPAKFNHAQRIAYTGVIALGLMMVITGLAIYKPAQLTWLSTLLGGYQTARLEHNIITYLFLLFFLVHITQVIRAGWNNFRAMITGLELVRTQKAEGQ